MAHKLLPITFNETRAKRNYTLPKINGKFGFAIMIGSKEIFVGIALNDVVEEKVIRKRFLNIKKGQVKTYGFDPV
jgi:hypothetical protein